jgi:hypothetical protein
MLAPATSPAVRAPLVAVNGVGLTSAETRGEMDSELTKQLAELIGELPSIDSRNRLEFRDEAVEHQHALNSPRGSEGTLYSFLGGCRGDGNVEYPVEFRRDARGAAERAVRRIGGRVANGR